MNKKHSASFYLKWAIIKLIFVRRFAPLLIYQKIKLLRIIAKGDRLRKKNEIKHQIAIPQICILSITNQCNLKCKGCYAAHYTQKDVLNETDIENIIKEATHLGIYMFIIVGGEPLLVENLITILGRYTKAIFLLFTNGLLLNKSILLRIKQNNHIIPVLSFEGSKDFNDYRRGLGTGSIIDQSLKLLYQGKVLFGFSTMAIHENINYITSKAYLDKMAKHGASFGFIIDYVPMDQNNNQSMCLNKKDISKKSDELMKRNHDSKMIFFNFPADEGVFNNCGAGKEIIHINASGYVEPCPFSHYAKDNIKQKSLIAILKSDFFTKLRENITKMRKEEGRCTLHLNEEAVLDIVNETCAFKTV